MVTISKECLPYDTLISVSPGDGKARFNLSLFDSIATGAGENITYRIPDTSLQFSGPDASGKAAEVNSIVSSLVTLGCEVVLL